MNAQDHERFTEDVGAYLLGALEPDEHEAFEAHLRDCERCGRDVARMRIARDALPSAVEQLTPPPELKASLMEVVRAEAREPEVTEARRPVSSRRSRWRDLIVARPRLAAAAAAVALALGVALGALAGAIGGGSDDPRTVAAHVDATRMPAGKASLVIPDDERGAILRVEGMQQPPAGQVYEVWVQRGDDVTPSSLFSVSSNGSGAAAVPDALDGADTVMVTREPRGGSRQPSERPVVTVRLRS